MFTDLFLYGIIVPTLPFILSSRLHLPHNEMQQSISLLLAYYAGASVVASLPAGYIADHLPSHQLPFLSGLLAMLISTALLWLGQTWTILAIARVFQGISASVVWTVGLTMILDAVGSRNLGVVLSSIFGFICVGELLAPVLGGIIYQQLGEAWVFGVGFLMLAFDLVVRILVVEKKVVKRYGWDNILFQKDSNHPNETSPLISTKDKTVVKVTDISSESLNEWKLPSNVPNWFSKIPILYLTSNSPRISASLLLCLTHSMTLGIFDATIPLESFDLFSFTSRSAGLLFIPLILPYLLLAPIAGLIVDRYGTKIPTAIGLLILASPLTLFGTVKAVSSGQEGHIIEVIKFSVLLSICGIGIAFISSQSIIDESFVVDKYEKANPELFPDGAPYAQLYAMNNVVFSLGLTLGPLIAGSIRTNF
ncbi:hypothetical protein EPUL_003738, partial [Erysiphe pulchra]